MTDEVSILGFSSFNDKSNEGIEKKLEQQATKKVEKTLLIQLMHLFWF